jgi:hypothetical protein
MLLIFIINSSSFPASFLNWLDITPYLPKEHSSASLSIRTWFTSLSSGEWFHAALPLSLPNLKLASNLLPKENPDSSLPFVIDSVSNWLQSHFLWKHFFAYPKLKVIYSTLLLCELSILGTSELIHVYKNSLPITDKMTTLSPPSNNQSTNADPLVLNSTYLFSSALVYLQINY